MLVIEELVIEELGVRRLDCLWIAGLYHFVQIRKAKHSATLNAKYDTGLASNQAQLPITQDKWGTLVPVVNE